MIFETKGDQFEKLQNQIDELHDLNRTLQKIAEQAVYDFETCQADLKRAKREIERLQHTISELQTKIDNGKKA